MKGKVREINTQTIMEDAVIHLGASDTVTILLSAKRHKEINVIQKNMNNLQQNGYIAEMVKQVKNPSKRQREYEAKLRGERV